MLTIFTIPKSFNGIDDIHQRNAIQSWLAIRPECEVILCGNDQGTAEVAKEYGVVHIPNIGVNEFGTPYLNDAFERAQEIAKTDLICYVNADIIFFDDILVTVKHIPFKEYLIVGSRWDIDVDQLIDFHSPYSCESFKNTVLSNTCLKYQTGSDYFIFKKHSLGELPAFVVGRPFWDFWMIFNARAKHLPVIDASHSIMDVHQNHSYAHVSGGINNTWYGPEGDDNNEYVGDEKRFTLWDCTHLIDENYKISKTKGNRYLSRKIKTTPILKPRKGLLKRWQDFVQKFLMYLYFRRAKIPYWLLENSINFLYKLS
jgi:hypothetical protein